MKKLILSIAALAMIAAAAPVFAANDTSCNAGGACPQNSVVNDPVVVGTNEQQQQQSQTQDQAQAQSQDQRQQAIAINANVIKQETYAVGVGLGVARSSSYAKGGSAAVIDSGNSESSAAVYGSGNSYNVNKNVLVNGSGNTIK